MKKKLRKQNKYDWRILYNSNKKIGCRVVIRDSQATFQGG